MEYKTVYSPEGEMFEVTANKFYFLVLEKGWTQTQPSVLGNPVEDEFDTSPIPFLESLKYTQV